MADNKSSISTQENSPIPTQQTSGIGRTSLVVSNDDLQKVINSLSKQEKRLNDLILDLRSSGKIQNRQTTPVANMQQESNNKKVESSQSTRVLAETIDLFATKYDITLKESDDLDPYKKWSTDDADKYPVAFLKNLFVNKTLKI